MECICHGMLECGAHILKIERHDTICEGTPRCCECGLVLILGAYVNLIVIEEAIHEGEEFMIGTYIDDLVNKGCRIIAFGTCPIKIVEVHAHAKGPLFLGD